MGEALARREAELASGRASLARAEERLAHLDRVATLLSERVVARERELRTLRESQRAAAPASRLGAPKHVELAGDVQTRGDVERRGDGEAPHGAEGAGALVPPVLEGEELRITRTADARARETGDRTSPSRGERRATPPSQPPVPDAASVPEAPTGPAGADEPGDGRVAALGQASSLTRARPAWDGAVTVDVGPFGDFSGLVGFEDAAAAIAGVESVRVTRFAGGRASLSLELERPLHLPDALVESAPCELLIRQAEPGRLVLDIVE